MIESLSVVPQPEMVPWLVSQISAEKGAVG